MELLFKVALFLIAVFMILLILVQKGKGGGLAGALGGPGGSSAFGAKAGDAFTRITAYTALVWMFVCISAALYFSGGRSGAEDKFSNLGSRRSAPATEGAAAGEAGAEGAGAATESTDTPAADAPAAETPAAGAASESTSSEPAAETTESASE
ncbi:preprotein translocase subunit SecG [Aeoliella sp. SH292]|uniref:preprotein translocase subunit SecG n=1 Tax=Aeoliella sp. SH292 TaxID=3454464 RepID=UPI003F9BF11B